MPDPTRFKPFQESVASTLKRTVGIALGITIAIMLTHLHGVPANAFQWRAVSSVFLFGLWITLGGHFVELFYLNVLRLKLANLSDGTLVVIRLIIWLIGGTLLVLAGTVTRSLALTGDLPTTPQLHNALLYGGLAFAAIEMVFPHTILYFSGKPSFWNRRG